MAAQYVILSDVDEARKIQRICMRLYLLPKKGRNTGGGRHVEAPSSPPTPDAHPVPGWDTRYASFVSHPSGDGRLAMKVKSDLIEFLQNKPGRLPPSDRTWLQNKLSGAAELTSDWETDMGAYSEIVANTEVAPEPEP